MNRLTAREIVWADGDLADGAKKTGWMRGRLFGLMEPSKSHGGDFGFSRG